MAGPTRFAAQALLSRARDKQCLSFIYHELDPPKSMRAELTSLAHLCAWGHHPLFKKRMANVTGQGCALLDGALQRLRRTTRPTHESADKITAVAIAPWTERNEACSSSPRM